MKAKTLMLTGSMSSVGKSLLTAGLCRIYARKGLLVYPFKAQNMSNNAAVCPSGGEIGRAQAIQAAAAGVEPVVQMNPVLLKPEADHRSQVILLGEVIGSFSGTDYYARRKILWEPICHSLDALREKADLVLIEGAGSLAELNLRQSDVANLAVARYAQAPCLLIGDIDRGGIFAQLAGSWWLLDQSERPYIKAFIVNKFRGELSLFRKGLQLLSQHSEGIPVAWVVPYLPDHGIADEDAAAFSPETEKNADAKKLCVIKLPHISNFDDFDPLKAEPNVTLRFTVKPEELSDAAAILLPGSKSTLDDLRWLRGSGNAEALIRAWQAGSAIAGICGGYQLLGRMIRNPNQIESTVKECAGLGILPAETLLSPRKKVTQTQMTVISHQGFLQPLAGTTLQGYEIHNGITTSDKPLFAIAGTNTTDGALGRDQKSFGTYLHGIFENDVFRGAWLKTLGISPSPICYRELAARNFDRLADHLEAHLDMDLIDSIIEKGMA